ncbi:Ammecr1l [Acrasis kona]|uniref:Ammecr1l n=1 Tax=Acrasis kona TaxID=1008807 RepID=A0AAW2YT31_9EUKA
MRVIIHLDIDCFYAQAEIVQDESLRGKPVGVQQNQTISTCNYEARARGLGKMVNHVEARKLIPDLVVIQSHMELYREESAKIFERLNHICSDCLVEISGIDEAFVDVTERVNQMLSLGNEHVFYGHSVPTSHKKYSEDDLWLVRGSEIAHQVRETILIECGYQLSAGVANNKLLSKLVTSLNKPFGQTTLFQLGVNEFLNPLMLRKIPKIGRITSEKLFKECGYEKIRDVTFDSNALSKLTRAIGETTALYLQSACNGVDDSKVIPKGLKKSFMSEFTFLPVSIKSTALLTEKINILCEDLSQRLVRDISKNQRTPTRVIVRYTTVANNGKERAYRSVSSAKDSLSITGKMSVGEIHKVVKELSFETLKNRLSQEVDYHELFRMSVGLYDFSKINGVTLDEMFNRVAQKRSISETLDSDYKLALSLQKEENNLELAMMKRRRTEKIPKSKIVQNNQTQTSLLRFIKK